MPKTKQQKQQSLKDTKEKLKKANSVVFTDNSGIGVNGVNELRSRLKEFGATMVVTKNSLINKASSDIDLKGPTAVIYGFEGIVEPIKELYNFIRRYELPKVKLGIVEGEIISAEKVEQLSKLPSLNELRTRLVGSIMSPLSNFVGVNREVYSSFVRTLNAIKDNKKS